jgi:hypothetical protein
MGRPWDGTAAARCRASAANLKLPQAVQSVGGKTATEQSAQLEILRERGRVFDRRVREGGHIMNGRHRGRRQ